VKCAIQTVGYLSAEKSAWQDLHIANETVLLLVNLLFPKEEKEPLTDAAHVRNAVARFNQVQGVTDAERDAAWKRIRSAAKSLGVEIKEADWRELSHGGKSRA
jgi:hypothetical protein